MIVGRIAIMACISLALSSVTIASDTENLEPQAHPLYSMELYARDRSTLSAKLVEAGETKERADTLAFKITQFTAICSVNKLAESSMPQSRFFLNLLRSEDQYDDVVFIMRKTYSEMELLRFHKYLANVTDDCYKVAKEEYLSR